MVAIESFSNLLEEESQDVLVLDSKDITDPEVVMAVEQVEALGGEQFRTSITKD